MQSFFKLGLKRHFLTVGLLILISLQSSAQTDIVYLKDGSEVKGKIVGLDSLGKLKIRIHNHTEISLSTEEVSKFRIQEDENQALDNSEQNLKKRTNGFINITQIGFLAGKSTNESDFWSRPAPSKFASLSVESYNGYKFNNYISSGVSAGLDVYEEGILIPLGFSLHGNFLDKKITPTAFFSAGYSPAWPEEKTANREFKGGYFLNTGLGFLVRSGESTAFTFHVSYKNQKATLKEGNQEQWFNIEERNYKRISFMMGFSF